MPRIGGEGYTPARIHEELTEALVAKSVGNLLAQARAQTGRTLRDVGAAVGVSFGRIQQLETSENVKLSTLVRVADALGFGVQIALVPQQLTEKSPPLKPITANLSDLAHI